MKFDPEIHIRKSIRLKGYDYSFSGGYFVTIVSFKRACLFGEVVDGAMAENSLGKIVWEEWFRSASIRKEIHLYKDEFVIMPNHVHGIIWIDADTVGADGVRPDEDAGADAGGAYHEKKGALHAPLHRQPRSLGSFIAGFKASVTHRAIRELTSRAGDQPASAVSGSSEPDNSGKIWQRNYYEHIIRDQADYERICGYIIDNPANWNQDDENPQHPTVTVKA
jgi:putative transposase